MDDVAYMLRCISLAELGAGNVSPNPMVGCIIVQNDTIVGEGFHAQYGGPHAEVNAIQNAISRGFDTFENATMYVSLEPCAHHGKTPPCADMIIERSFKKVVIASRDPNPLVAGKGIEKMQAAGIEVVENICDGENRMLNAVFFTFYQKKRPYITLKWAQSRDGFIAKANYVQVKLSNEFSDIYVHKMRAEHMAILIGGRTAVNDNPQLNVRLWNGKSPLRIVLDTKGTVPKNLHIVDNTIPTLIFNPLVEGKSGNTEFIKCIGKDNIKQVLKYLYQNNISSLLVEGGARTISNFIAGDDWDAIHIIETPHVIGKGIPAPVRPEMASISEQIFDNTIVSYYHL